MLSQLFHNPTVLLMCALLAAIPVGVYMWVFLKEDPEPKRLIVKTFIFGCFSVLPIAIMQYIFSVYSQFDVYSLIKDNVKHIGLMWILMYLFVGATEEYFKHWVVVLADDTDKDFRTVDDGIELSIIAALGFAFIEHIVYFTMIYHRGGWEELLVPFIFRSILTTLAHAAFSGIYGYYYGKSHFMKSEWHREKTLLRGLLSAMILHGIFNTLLEFNMVYLIVPLLAGEVMFIMYELKQNQNKKIHQGQDEE